MKQINSTRQRLAQQWDHFMASVAGVALSWPFITLAFVITVWTILTLHNILFIIAFIALFTLFLISTQKSNFNDRIYLAIIVILVWGGVTASLYLILHTISGNFLLDIVIAAVVGFPLSYYIGGSFLTRTELMMQRVVRPNILKFAGLFFVLFMLPFGLVSLGVELPRSGISIKNDINILGNQIQAPFQSNTKTPTTPAQKTIASLTSTSAVISTITTTLSTNTPTQSPVTETASPTTNISQNTTPITTASFTITGVVASDNFESDALNGGQGWASGWNFNNATLSKAAPHSGDYDLQIIGGNAQRQITLSQSQAGIQFWAKLSGMNANDTASVQWGNTTVYTWTSTSSNDAWQLLDLDISALLPNAGSSTVWLNFQISGSGSLSVDDLQIVTEPPATPLPTGVLAWDNFESGNGIGGQGWASIWNLNNAVLSQYKPNDGDYDLQIKGGNAQRQITISQSRADLQFWAKVNGMNTNDTAFVQWGNTTIHTWTSTNSDSIWHLYNVDLSALLPNTGSSTVWLNFQINGSGSLYIDDLQIINEPPATPLPTGVLAWDNFESGNGIGGQGWASIWNLNNAVPSQYEPHSGDYDLQITGGNAQRQITLSQSQAGIQFWAKLSGMNTNDTAFVQWGNTTVHTWTNTNSDGIWQYYNIDISPLLPNTGSSTVWLNFQISGSGSLSVDDLQIVTEPPATPLPTGVLAWDNFESGNGIGGQGWASIWNLNNAVLSQYEPNGGDYDLQIKGGNAQRQITISQSRADLQFWAKVNGMNTNDTAFVQWGNTTIHTWTSTNSDSIWHLYNVDLSALLPNTGSSTVWLNFQINGSGSLYIDDLQIINEPPATPLPTGVLAWDNFESGNGIGGQGWASIWNLNNAVPSQYEPHSGDYDLQITGGNAQRQITLSQSQAGIQFWAKLSGMNTNDTASVQWGNTTITTWTNTNSNGIWQYYNINLSSFLPKTGSTTTVWVNFQISGSGSLDIDDLQVVTGNQ